MELNLISTFICSSFLLLCFLPLGSSTSNNTTGAAIRYGDDGIDFSVNDINSRISSGAIHTMQAQGNMPCGVYFEFLSYGVLFNECKPPAYPASQCCPAFKRFACQYQRELNDPASACAADMFKYINYYGAYPPGLFTLQCPGVTPLECH